MSGLQFSIWQSWKAGSFMTIPHIAIYSHLIIFYKIVYIFHGGSVDESVAAGLAVESISAVHVDASRGALGEVGL